MGVHFIVHRPRGASEKAEVAILRPALRVEEKRFAFMRMAATSHPPWATEALAKARRPRHLLQDNPASG